MENENFPTTKILWGEIMKYGKRGYGTYRGRATATDWLRTAAAVLFVLVLLAGAGLMFGQKYIIYTDNGLRLDLPFLREDTPEQPEEDLGDVTVVVEPQEPEVPVEPPKPPLRAVALPLASVMDGTALEQARAQEANAIVLDMKDDLGRLGYVSALSQAAHAGANVQGAEINEAIRALAAEDITLIARVSCFRDRLLAGDVTYAIESNSGKRWIDYESVRWSNPAKEGVRSYLTQIAGELAALGFDEIVLEHWGYPNAQEGQLGYIKKGAHYDPEQLDSVITQFLGEMQDALEETETVLSLRGPAAVLEGAQDQSGCTLEQLAGLEGRIWLENPQGALTALEGAGMEQAEEHMVSLVSTLEDGVECHQAVVN